MSLSLVEEIQPARSTLSNDSARSYMIHRRDQLRASQIMAERTQEHEKINIIWDSAIKEILPDDNGKTRAVSIENLKNGEVTEVSCKGVFKPLDIYQIHKLSPGFYHSIQTDI